MKSRQLLFLVGMTCAGASPGLVTSARAQTTRATGASQAASTQPLRLDYSASKPAEATSSQPGFWIFPSRPPLHGSMSSDRPGFSDNYALVPRGYHHLEFGYTFAYDREQSTRVKTHTLGEFSLRTGLTDEFELRIKWSGYSFAESLYPDTSPWAGRHIMSKDHDDGGTDMSIGFKSPLLKQDGLIPNLSIIPAISLPTGTASKSTGDVDPEIRLAWNYSLTPKWSVYGVGLATVLSDDDGRFFQSGASLATFYQFTPQLGGFLEYYGLYPSSRGSDCQHNVDFGPVILVNDNFQIDIRAGFGLNEEAPDFQAGIGFCFRF
ncbi:hypothetical protein RAS1_17910 [Phycisphaerae bacterium RAS1]|nr:hypothetical protein RAS1_17910 [Phycisphaerae bacterium RAS1]